MTHYEDGAMVMDTDYAPQNSETPLNEPSGPIKYIVVQATGLMETHMGMVLEDTEEVRKAIEENPEVKIIASGTTEVSIAELIYTIQSPTRQMYRAFAADVKELINNRFTNDDNLMREICNSSR